MTVKDKANEIIAVSDANMVYDIVDFKALHEAQMEDLLEMSDWLIERAAAWLENNYHDYEWRDDFDMNQLIIDFRQCLKTDSL